MKKPDRRRRATEYDREYILSELERLRALIYKNEQLFDIADDPEVTEALIYEHKALTLRLSGLISRAKSLGITSGYTGERR